MSDAQSEASSVPYYMRDDSDDSTLHTFDSEGRPLVEGQQEVEGMETDEVQGKGKSKEKEKKRRSFFKKNKARVGKVDLDPRIDYARFSKLGPGLDSKASIQDDGTIDIWVKLKSAFPDIPSDYAPSIEEADVDPTRASRCPPLAIVIFIVGSRGDVQPYLSLALRLILNNGHRVRIATHPDFKDFVLNGNKRLVGKKYGDRALDGHLEFFDVGGDPKSLMAYMVKNPGLMPGWESMRNGDIGAKRRMTADMLQGFYQSTFTPDPVSGRPFAADAIISNPPAFGHIHIAEALGIPLHMTFTMPWTVSTTFHHPLVNIKDSNAEQRTTNYLSFALADMMTWQGLGDIINAFRSATLGLEPLTAKSGPSVLDRTKVPWTYCWSQSLIEKPKDWKENIDISGFYFLEADTDFKPAPELEKFLSNGDPPIYIGFGSVVVEDAAAMTKTIFEAVESAGVRALVSAGWGGLGGTDVPDSVFILKGNIPHDWLFADGRVAAVCHHGGAGTTAIGLRNGLPTIVVPFFGDQQFWGDMIHRAGGGPKPIPQKKLSVENLAQAIKFAVSPEAKTAAGVMGEKIRAESGEEKGVQSFHAHLPLKSMICDVAPERSAQWWSPKLALRISAGAVGVLQAAGKIDIKDLQHLRAKEYQTRWRAKDPITGSASGLFLMLTNHYGGVAQMFWNPSKGVKNYATAIPQGLADVIIGVHEGFDAIPAQLGSEVRPRGKVDSFSSGVREGGKGLVYGWWDGITGLATEPIAGAKKHGPAGFVKGAMRSWVNVTARPAAGVLGMMALPLHGSWLSLRKKIAGAPERALRESHEALAKLEASEMSEDEKKRILDRFEVLLEETEQRQKALKKKAEIFLQKMKEEAEDAELEQVKQGD